MTSSWTSLLELDSSRTVTAGSATDLCAALGRGADLRVYTEWIYEEHVAPDPDDGDHRCDGTFQEVIDFRETYLVEGDYAAGITTLRQSMLPVVGFNPDAGPRMFFFLYDMDGRQGCSHVMLDEQPYGPPDAHREVEAPAKFPKLSPTQLNDEGSSGPSMQFVYEFERYRYWIRDDWELMFAHEADGTVTDGSWRELHDAHQAGKDIKVGLVNLCADLAGESREHVVFSPAGSSWTHTPTELIETQSHPLVRVAPGKPLGYAGGNWDVAWVFIRSTGEATIRRLDPYTRRFEDRKTRLGCRWYVR